MEIIEKQAKEKNTAIHANKIPAEIVGRFLKNLSVGDRVKTQRVSPRWKWALSKWGWTEQRKLNADIVFEGSKFTRFWVNLDDGSCQLTSLINCCGPWLRVLDLSLFGSANIGRFLPRIAESLHSIEKLDSLCIQGLYLQDFVDHLPQTLHELKVSGEINFETLQTLSDRCPNLEGVPYRNLENIHNLETEAVIKLVGKFLGQKKLDLRYFWLRSEKQGALASIGQLKMLEELNLWHCVSLDGESLGAIIEGCQRLRSFAFDARKLTEGELSLLARIQNLTVLEVDNRLGGGFSDAVLNAIAKRRQLKKFCVVGLKSDESLTDASILYLLDRCRSLVSLAVYWYPQISDRSLEAVVAESRRRRHGTAPGTLPSGVEDPRIFYFHSNGAGIDEGRAHELIAGNPWIRFGYDPREII